MKKRKVIKEVGAIYYLDSSINWLEQIESIKERFEYDVKKGESTDYKIEIELVSDYGCDRPGLVLYGSRDETDEEYEKRQAEEAKWAEKREVDALKTLAAMGYKVTKNETD